MSGISTHILDTSLGRPAAGVPVTLERNIDGRWSKISERITDSDGRVKQLLPEGEKAQPGQYRLIFATGVYYESLGVDGLYPIVEITFTVRSGHYHIPLLLTANGYSTYRGS